VSEVLTKEVWDAMEALLDSLEPTKYTSNVFISEDNMVLSGGAITDVGGGNFDVAAGIAYFKTSKVIARFPAAAGLNPTIATLYINLLSPITEQKTFADAGVKDYAVTYNAEVSVTAATEYVTGYASTGFPAFFPTPQFCLDSVVDSLQSDAGFVGMLKYELGTWDMDTAVAATTIPVAASGNVTKEKIISVSCIIREDSTTGRRQFDLATGDGSAGPHGWIELTENDGDGGFDIDVFRVGSKFFDSTSFNGTVDNRGYVIVHYDNS
jgi:hypothetical protein